jgi:hypothetical protein
LLTKTGLIERVPSPVPHHIYFRFKPGGWVVFMRQRLRLLASLHQIAERGLELLKDQDPALLDHMENERIR